MRTGRSRQSVRRKLVSFDQRQMTLTVMVMSLELVVLPEASVFLTVRIAEYMPLEGTLQLKSTETS